MGPILHASPLGCTIAAALVVAGAPLFSGGLRALRLRRRLAGLPETALGRQPEGLVRLRGRVALESPLVGPLSGKPCAGYRLDVRGAGGAVVATIEDLRPFRIVADGVAARVLGAEAAIWAMNSTQERTLAPGDPVSENLSALLARSPEATWIRRCGATVTLVERTLLAGQECHVIGSARHGRVYELASVAELARTGTDDLFIAVGAARPDPESELWIESDAQLDYLRISDHPPQRSELHVPAWRMLGIAVGPALSLAGLLYLANALDTLRSTRSF